MGATVRVVHAAPGRRLGLIAVSAVLAATLLFGVARAVSPRYHDDSLWANTLASLGGTIKPGDFGYVFLPAGNEVLAGRSPYSDPDLFEGPPQAPYAYPPVLAYAVAPLAMLPEEVANTFLPGVLFTLVLIAATFGGLWLLGVRDWRCYPVALLSPATLEAFEYGAIGPILLLLVAVAWRYRDRTEGAGLAIGGTVVAKLFLWPLLVWLALTGRIRAAFLGVGTALVLAFASWLAIGFEDIADYPRLLRKLVDVEAENSYSTFAILRTIGLSELPSQLVVLALGGGLLVLAWRAARGAAVERERDRRSLTFALAAALVLTPILWLHYLVFLFVPIALARPRLSALWFAPLGLTVFEALDWYRGWPAGDAEALTSVAVLTALVFAACVGLPGASEPQRKAAPVGALRPGP